MKPKSLHRKFMIIGPKVLSVLMLASLLLTSVPAPQTVIAQVTISAQMNKSFTPISIIPGEISTLEIEIFNPNTYPLTNMSWTDNLVGVQPGMYIADNPNITNTCGGTVTANPGGTQISLSGGSVAAAVGLDFGSCLVRVDVSSITQGNLINRIPVGELQATGDAGSVSNTDPVEETLLVQSVDDPSVSKSFSPNTVWVGQSSQMTITVRNNDNTVTLTEVSLVDNLPAGVVLTDPLSVSLSNCGSGTYTAASGGSSVTLNDATIAPGATCQIRASVVSNSADTYTNTIPVGEVGTANGIQTKQGVTNASTASANLNVQSVGLSKSFSPTQIIAGETTTLTITLQNPTGSNYTGVKLDDVLPTTDLTIDAAETNCTSDNSTTSDPLIISIPNDQTVSLIDGNIPAGDVVTPGSCTITAVVRAIPGAADQTHTNRIDPDTMVTDQGATNSNSAAANINVDPLGIDVDKSLQLNADQSRRDFNRNHHLNQSIRPELHRFGPDR
jgi:uncharacterized repeat protein (TIGR01451 family)